MLEYIILMGLLVCLTMGFEVVNYMVMVGWKLFTIGVYLLVLVVMFT